MIKDIIELNFPAYATFDSATVTINDMGDRSISAQVKISGDVIPDFSYDWEVEFKGERYIHPVRNPQGSKDNTSLKSKIDMTFQHWAIYEMKRQYFVEMTSTSAGTAIADKYIASLGLNLGDFVTAFNLVLNHYFGNQITINLNPNWQYDSDAKFVGISYSYIWDVLQQMHEIYGVRWTLRTNSDGVCEILMGYPTEEVSHIFEYGFDGGLLSVQRQVQSTEIRNRLLGRGGEKNLPYRYFKDADPNNPLYEADPDWIPELANVAFTELRGKTFRDYVKGWKAKRYGGAAMADPTDAYLAGYDAEKFDPIEYVDDEDSITKYGVLVGALENNDEIYPSIQGAPGNVDAIVDAEQVTDDDVDSAIENDSIETNVEGMSYTQERVESGVETAINISEKNPKVYFSVPEGKRGTILTPSFTAVGKAYSWYYEEYKDVDPGLITVHSDNCSFIVRDSSTGEEVSRLNIPPGEYYYEATVAVSHANVSNINITASVSSILLVVATDNDSSWSQTFDIWVRNIWGSTRNSGETDQQYADRVWLPILGDRLGNEARVVFSSGWLSFSSDWEFPIVGYAYDNSKSGAEWRLTLAKSEAELEASGKYIPYEGYNASAGDKFFFIGIDMPYQYVLWAEERLDEYKRDSLLEVAEIKPTWVIKTDKIKLNQDSEGARLVDLLSAGAQVRLASRQFISGAYESLYIQSLTYTWQKDTLMYPDLELVVSDKVIAVKNPVVQMRGDIETIQRQVGNLSNIQQIIRQVCDTLYLRKDGVSDISKSPTKFLGKITGENFRQGQIGGKDWGIYRDENGNAILEADKFVARKGIVVSDLVVNEATYVGGIQINSAASMNVTAVEDTDAGYVCYFDQKQGTVTNKFLVDDVVLCQKFDAEKNEVKFYKSRVIAVAETSVTLSKTDKTGSGVPTANDVIIHYGSYTNTARQFVIVRDVIGGGYERMLMGLDSVNSDGVEYYFAGKTADSSARWFVGDVDQYVKYENGQITIKGNLLVTDSDIPVSEQIAGLDYIRQAFGDGTQGLILGKAIIVGYNNDGTFVPMAGLSGVYDSTREDGGHAAWYGGTPENAKSVIFMDGTGYFADGLFKWDKETGVNLGNDAIKINYDGSVEFGENIKISAEGDETLGSILTMLAQINSWFAEDADGNVFLRNNRGLYSTSFISARGSDPNTGGGGGGGGSSYLNELLDVGLVYSDLNSGDMLVWDKTSQKYIVINKSIFALASSLNEYQPKVSSSNKIPYAYISGVPTALKSPYALIIAGKSYDGSGEVTITAEDLGAITDLSNYYTKGEVDALIPSLAGYATEDWVEGKKYLTTINSAMVISALGFTPYNATNPNGYTSNRGTVTSVKMTAPTGFSVSGSPITSEGTLALVFASGYSLPTTAKQANWDTAYGWGDHSVQDYATRSFVNSSIATATATFRGTFTSLSSLQATSGDMNDYAFYKHVDSYGNTVFDRYKYSDGTWVYEYTLNNSSFTAEQWSAINSGITEDLVELITVNEGNIAANASAIATNRTSITNLGTQITSQGELIDDIEGRFNEDGHALNAVNAATAANATKLGGQASSYYAAASALNNYALKTRKVSAGTGLTGGGTLEADRTISLATSGVTAGTYTKTTVDAYGRVTGGTTLSASDIPTLAISKITNLQTTLNGLRTDVDNAISDAGDNAAAIITLQGYFANGVAKNADKLDGNDSTYFATASALTALTTRVSTAETNITNLTNNKLNKSVWDSVFEIDANGNLKVKVGLYSTSFVSARGSDPNAGGGGGGSFSLYTWDLIQEMTSEVSGVAPTAYALKQAYDELNEKATNVSFRQTETDGTLIGVITIDDVAQNIYAPTIPTSLKNPYALTFGSKTYDGSAARTILASDLGALTAHQSIYTLTFAAGAFSAGSFVANSAAKTIKVPTHTSHLTNNSGYITADDIPTTIAWGNVTGKPAFAAVATSGSYNDLSNKPTIPTNNNQLTNGAGYITASALSGYATESFVGSNYLPLSGGTISGNLQIGSTDNTSYRVLRMVRSGHAVVLNNTDTYGSLSFGTFASGTFTREKGLEFGDSGLVYIDGSTARTLIHSGNYSDYALPLSGGTLTGNLVVGENAIVFNKNVSTSWANPLNSGIRILNSIGSAVEEAPSNYGVGLSVSGNYGFQLALAHSSKGFDFKMRSTRNGIDTPYDWVSLLHSDNYSDYALKLDGSNARATKLTSDKNLDDYQYGFYSYTNGNNPTNSFGDNTALFAFTSNRGNDTWQIAFDGNGIQQTVGPRFGIRGNYAGQGWTSWFRIATTESNVASATKLQTARTIWGQSFDGTGNVSGHLTLGNAVSILGTDSGAAVKSIMSISAENSLIIGHGSSAAGIPTYINGSTLYFRYGTSRTLGMLINSNGNVTIGASDLAGTSAKLYVDGDIQLSNNASIIGGGSRNAFETSRTDLYIGSGYTASGDRTFLYGNVIRMYAGTGSQAVFINSSGNVTIGASDLAGTSAKLYVNGTAKVKNEIILENASYSTTGEGSFLLRYYNGYLQFSRRDANNAHLGYPLIITHDTGNILINRTSDNGHRLQVAGNIAINKSDDSIASLYLLNNTNSQWRLSGHYDISGYPLSFEYYNGTSWTSGLAISNGGNVGIGTTSPSYKLDVNGKIRFEARTIWGQSFDGTGNVEGDLTLGGNSIRVTFPEGTEGTLLSQTAYGYYQLGYSHAAFGYNAKIYGTAIGFFTSTSAERMRITDNGNVGIGTTEPAYKLDVAGTLRATGAATFSSTLDAAGVIHSSAGIWSEGYVSARGQDSSSDRRLKENISPIKNALAYVLDTNYVAFNWKDTRQRSIGIIAQEELDREWGCLVQKNTETYSYLYGQHIALVGAAIQEEDKKVEELKAEISRLKEKVNELETRLYS